MFGFAENEHPRLAYRGIIFEKFQHVTIHQRHRRTDRQTTCDRKTALCTKVHRAVKKTLKTYFLQKQLYYNLQIYSSHDAYLY